MNKFNWKAVWSAICLTVLTPLAFGQVQNSNAPGIFAVIQASGIDASPKLANISSDGIREISNMSGQWLYGMDEDVVVFVETHGSGSGKRLLVVDRKTSAIIAEKNVQGIHPVLMKVGNVERLGVRSKEFTVYIPVFDGHSFDVVEVNWRTGVTRRLPVSFAEGAKRWEITALYSIPPGIAIERGPFLTIFDPTTNINVLTLNNAGSDLRPTGNYYAFPGFGLVQSVKAKDMLYQITEKDFTTMIPSPAGVSYPDSITNLIKYSRPITWTIRGKPCLIWGETEAGMNPQDRNISEIVVFDLESKKIMLRKALGPDFLPEFLTDPTGRNIYFINSQAGEIFRLNLESQKISRFANSGTNRFDCLVAAN